MLEGGSVIHMGLDQPPLRVHALDPFVASELNVLREPAPPMPAPHTPPW
jgi:hypothetical protein